MQCDPGVQMETGAGDIRAVACRIPYLSGDQILCSYSSSYFISRASGHSSLLDHPMDCGATADRLPPLGILTS